MARRAEFLLAQIESELDPVKVQARLAMEIGQTENAFGRSKSDEILFLNLPATNTTPDKSNPSNSAGSRHARRKPAITAWQPSLPPPPL